MTDLHPIAYVFMGAFLALLACWWLVVRPYLAAAAFAACQRANDAHQKLVELQAAYDEAANELPRAKFEWKAAIEALEIAATEETGSEISYIPYGEEKMAPHIDALFLAERQAFEHWQKTFRSVRQTYFALHGEKLHEYRDWEGRYGCDEEHYRFFYKTDDDLKTDAQRFAKSHEVRKKIALGKWEEKLEALRSAGARGKQL